jgi:hypothetical protein
MCPATMALLWSACLRASALLSLAVKPVSERCFAPANPSLAMQVYASYKYRRDFAEVAKAEGRAVQLLEPLQQEAAARGWVQGPLGAGAAVGPSGGSGERKTALDRPTMRQAIAWEFALRAIHEREVSPGRAESHGIASMPP